jgi:plastocyanin
MVAATEERALAYRHCVLRASWSRRLVAKGEHRVQLVLRGRISSRANLSDRLFRSAALIHGGDGGRIMPDAEDGEPALKREHLETILSFVAAIASSVAAIGAFFTGFYSMQSVNLERIPAIHLACRPEYRLAERAANIDQPEETLLLRPSGGEWIHVGGSAGMDAHVDAPDPFARCTVKNFGRLPLLDMSLPVRLSFSKPDGLVVHSTFMLELPGLSPDAAYEFSLLNGSPDVMRIAFDRTVLLSAMDANGRTSQHLFVDARVPEIERMQVEPSSPDAAMNTGGKGASLVAISGFAFRPGALHVRPGTVVTFVNSDAEAHTVTAVDQTFDSGTMDPGQRWKHRFQRPGRYMFECLYHPYMHGEVDVQ